MLGAPTGGKTSTGTGWRGRLGSPRRAQQGALYIQEAASSCPAALRGNAPTSVQCGFTLHILMEIAQSHPATHMRHRRPRLSARGSQPAFRASDETPYLIAGLIAINIRTITARINETPFQKPAGFRSING